MNRFCLFTATLILLGTSVLRAEIYTEYTKGTFAIPGSMVTPVTSNLGLVINLAGVATATIPLTELMPNSYLIVDKNLDSSGSGYMYLNGGKLTVEDFSYSVPIGVLGTVTATGTNMGFSISAGPIAITNNSFYITSWTTGRLTMIDGTFRIAGSLLGQNINVTLNFLQNPIGQDFTGLLTPIPGYADINDLGSDTDLHPHVSPYVYGYLPDVGLTGLSIVDTDGAETFINYNGFAIPTTIISGSLTLPMTITFTGSATVSVPEVSSVLLISASLSGLCLLVARKRNV